MSKQAINLMTTNTLNPIDAEFIGTNYILGVYKGSLSTYDILIKYKELSDNKWSRIRTPKHIHWAVDMLIKAYTDEKTTIKLLDYLLEQWNSINPINNFQKQKDVLNDVMQLNIPKEFSNLNYGIYSIEFLFRLAFLLMIQEKTNNPNAFMFKDLLCSLRNGDDLFKVISIATHH